MAFSGKPTCKLLLILTLSFLLLFTTFHHFQQNKKTLSRNTIFHSYSTFLSSSNNSTIATHLRHLTLHPHLAGTISTALYVHSHFKSLNLKTHLTNFTTLLSYPIYSSLSIHFPNGTITHLHLSEPDSNDVIMPYHAYSPSGFAYAKPLFLNYGRDKDFVELVSNGVDVKGCVGVVRRGGDLSRYDVVKNAEKRGVIAVIMYTEGEFKDGVERGTVMKGVGDPLSPGWASGEKLGLDDLRVKERFPGVPSIPVSENVAKSILEALEGEGEGESGIMLNFTYEGEKKMVTIYNVFAEIKGYEEPDSFVMLGNHRDAWTYGAVDPNSGTSVLLDIARRYALLLQSGWKPRRTIILCSWDAEEFGMIGSTEWVEQNLENLGSKAVAYLNVDCASQGPGFFVSATPQLDDLLVEVTKKVRDPDLDNEFLFARWTANNKAGNAQIGRLSRVDSDFAPFLQHAGVPSVDLYFGKDFPVYHTAFDSYDWMAKYGDPLFKRHVTVAGVWGLVALHLADDPILPFSYLSYAAELLVYRNVLSSMVGQSISLHEIDAAIQDFTTAANEAQEEAKKLRQDDNLGDSSALRRRMLNDRLMLAERGFLDSEGISGREWFKHLIYGPTDDPEANILFFPGIADALMSRTIKDEKKELIRHEIWRVSRAILRASRALRGKLT